MGPFLYRLYVNDITNTSNVLEFILFADDTTITLYSHSDFISKFDMIDSELQEVTNWFKANKLSVNASKTNYMLLGTNYKLSQLDESASIILHNTNLERVNDTEFIGVTINENINWTNHINIISKNISRVGNYQQTKAFCTWRFVISLYCTLILPYINYSIMAWGAQTNQMWIELWNCKRKQYV